MAETITLLGQRVDEVFVAGRIERHDGSSFASRAWVVWLGESLSCDLPLVRASVYDCGNGDYYTALQGEVLREKYTSPQAAANAIKEALRDLVNGEWHDAVEYLGVLREKRKDK